MMMIVKCSDELKREKKFQCRQIAKKNNTEKNELRRKKVRNHKKKKKSYLQKNSF